MANATTSDPAELLLHLSKGRDIVYFAEEILGLRLNPAQRRWFRLLAKLQEGTDWAWFYRRVIHVAANQIGKTLGLAVAILWASHNKIGVKTGNWDYWLNSGYKWFHLAPTHPQALLTMKDMRALVEGSHPAQYDRETGERRPVRWPHGFAVEVKFDGAYPGFRLWNNAEIHFRTTDDRAKALQGVRAHGISVDEAAFEDHLNDVLDQAVKLRLISTGGPLWLVSTPNGINDFFEVVQQVLAAARITFHERIWEAPARKWALVWSHITDNVGYGLTQEDVDFMEGDVDESTKEQQLRGAFLEPPDAFFVPNAHIKKAWRLQRNEDHARNGHRYVIFWDISVSADPTVVVVLDVTRKPWRGVYFQRWEKPMSVGALLGEMELVHTKWNTKDDREPGFAPRAITGFDATSMGGVVIKQMLARLRPQRPVNFAAKVKMNALTTARAVLSNGDCFVPRSWIRLQREVLGYRLEDKKLVQDSVMAFAGAAHVASQGFSGEQRRPFDLSYRTAVRR